MPNYKIIVNPISGRGSGQKAIPQIEQSMRTMQLDFDLSVTERPWHACELAQQAAEAGFDTVVSAGGDGTANEVLNGLMQARLNQGYSPGMGVLCVGRGNDFAFGMGIPPTLELGLQALKQNHRRTIDVGFVEGGMYPQGRYFGNGVGIGFDAVVGFEALKLAPLSGFLSYIVAALKTIFLYFNAPQVEIILDDQTLNQPALMVSIMNGRRMGGGFMMAPESSSEDGLFDACIVGELTRSGILKLMPRFMEGTQKGHPAVRFVRTTEIAITAKEGSLPAHSDGETLCTDGKKLSLRIIPHALEIIYGLPQEDK